MIPGMDVVLGYRLSTGLEMCVNKTYTHYILHKSVERVNGFLVKLNVALIVTDFRNNKLFRIY